MKELLLGHGKINQLLPGPSSLGAKWLLNGVNSTSLKGVIGIGRYWYIGVTLKSKQNSYSSPIFSKFIQKQESGNFPKPCKSQTPTTRYNPGISLQLIVVYVSGCPSVS